MTTYVITMCSHCGDKSHYVSRAPEKDVNCSECNNLMRKGTYIIRRYIDEEHTSRVQEHAGYRLH